MKDVKEPFFESKLGAAVGKAIDSQELLCFD